MAERFRTPNWQALDGNGNPYSGGKLSFFETLTSTPLETYSNDGLSSLNANPVVADGDGRFGDIFMQAQDYKVVLADSDDVTIWTADPVHGVVQVGPGMGTKAVADGYQVLQTDNGNLMLVAGLSVDDTHAEVTLPVAADLALPFSVGIKMVSGTTDSHVLAAEDIDGSSDVIHINLNESRWFVTDGVEWFIATDRTSGAIVSILSKTANYIILAEDIGKTILFDTGASTLTCTLPKTLSVRQGFTVHIKKVDGGAGKVVINTQSPSKISNFWTSVELRSQNQGVWFVNGDVNSGDFKGWFDLALVGSPTFVV